MQPTPVLHGFSQVVDHTTYRWRHPEWNGRPLAFPTDEGGGVSAMIRDGQACFNLNGVVQGGPGAWVARPRAAAS